MKTIYASRAPWAPILLGALATTLAVVALLAPSTAAAAVNPFCLPGSAPGKCTNPNGVASDFESGHTYVADRGNKRVDARVDAFESNGTSIGSLGGGQLTNPSWVAVDNDPTSASRHDVWVTTEKGAGAEFLVKKFKPSGEFIEADSFGDPAKEGSGECEFKANDPIAVGPNGNVYVADSYDKDGAGANEVFVSRVIAFEEVGGVCLGEVGGGPFFEGRRILAIAVDSTGHIYASLGNGELRKYTPTGTLEAVLDPDFETRGLAVDAANNLLAKQRDETVTPPGALIHFFSEYSPGGAVLKRFDYEIRTGFSVPALAAYREAPGEALHLYSSEGAGGIRDRKLPPPGPVFTSRSCVIKGVPGNTAATLQAEVNPEGKATSFKFEYLTEAKFEEEGGFSGAQSSAEEPLPPIREKRAGENEFEEKQLKSEEELSEAQRLFRLHEAALKVTGLEPETSYRCRVVAKNADGEAIGQEATFKTKEGFEFGQAWSFGVGSEEATVFLEGNPLGVPATGQVEYVDDAGYQASGFAKALSAPNPEIEFGASEAMQLRSVLLKGLSPATLYHYRLRARNGTPPEGIVCPEKRIECPELERSFRTYAVIPGKADNRAWELVSPAQKNGAEVAVPGSQAGLIEPRSIQIQAAAGSGEALTYTSWISFADAKSAPATSQYLSKRSAAGWQTENISPLGFTASPIFPPFTAFSPDLRFGAFKTSEPVLTPDCRTGAKGTLAENIYLRDNETGALRCLDPDVTGGPEGVPCLVYGGASEDGSRAFIAGPPEGGEALTYGLYESSAEGVHRVSILPGGEAAPASAGTAFGPGAGQGAGTGIENCQVSGTVLRHAISQDGSRAYWTYEPESVAEASRLFVRIGGTETLQLDALAEKTPGKGPAGGGVFAGASADGQVAYFTDSGRLLKGSKAEAGKPDLYSYQPGLSKPLADLSEGSAPGDVRGVVGISDDGSYVYFVAGAALAEGAEPTACSVIAPTCNLYLRHEGQTRFIAALSLEDSRDWSASPREISARVSPDGRHLAFLSVRAKQLAGYDNTIAAGQHCSEYEYDPTGESEPTLSGSPLCPQAFVYDADTEALSCASCNPSGARPLGPTLFPGWTNGFEGPRFLADDGSRLFFSSLDSLSPADQNGRLDVYEFERSGKGSCNASNADFDPASVGCHFLLSTGRSTDESFLVDASADGRDVFFSTRAKLVGWDTNENYDLYDYREGGGFPEPPPAISPCEGEGCKEAASPAPVTSGPSTPHFQGSGNLSEAPRPRCPKGRRAVRKAGKSRCVRAHKKKHTRSKKHSHPH